MSNTKIIVPVFIGAAILLIGARSISWETNHQPVGKCVGECYEAYKVEDAKRREAEAAMLATASPVDLGKKAYTACAACHGLNGEGGVGPKLQGQTKDAIVSMLTQYKNGETRGAQSALMWGQSAALSNDDMANLGAFVESL
ncbi:c-type cytochrome [Litoricolaceae bacterium]|nr:c-type cytochrome [Litorivicinaceae bacterium]MDA8705357.1 c-type cytochrome [Litorivicinaceae bacterium]MDC1076545.1 c-type cytochrome [Litorivicinus sp.]